MRGHFLGDWRVLWANIIAHQRRLSPGDLGSLERLVDSNVFCLVWQPEGIEDQNFIKLGDLGVAKNTPPGERTFPFIHLFSVQRLLQTHSSATGLLQTQFLIMCLPSNSKICSVLFLQPQVAFPQVTSSRNVSPMLSFWNSLPSA